MNQEDRIRLRRIRTSSQVNLRLPDLLRGPERTRFLRNMIAAARAHRSPLTVVVDVGFASIPPPEDGDEVNVVTPILNLIETKQPIQRLELENAGHTGDDDNTPAFPTYRYAERLLESAARNRSIRDISISICGITFEAATQLFQLAATKLDMFIVAFTAERGTREALIDALEVNASLERLKINTFSHTLDVMNSLGRRVGSNLKYLSVQEFPYVEESTVAPTLFSAIGSLVLRTPLKELELAEFTFPSAESFRSIAVAINCCNPTLAKVTFKECNFGLPACALLKQLDVLSLLVADVACNWRNDDPRYQYGEILQPGSSITHLFLAYGLEDVLPVVLQLLQGTRVLDTLSITTKFWCRGRTKDALLEHLPTLSGVRHLVLQCPNYTEQSNEIENLVGSLERNTSIEQVSVYGGDGIFSAAQRRRLQQIGRMNTFVTNLSRVLERPSREERNAWVELVASASSRFDDSSTALYRCVHALAFHAF